MNPKVTNNSEKIVIIEKHFAAIMETLGLNLKDASLKNTPNRVAKMYVNEIFAGLHKELPVATTFPNPGYNQMVVERNVTIFSVCEHHFVPIVGKCHIAYIPNKKVVGLSKMIRVAQHFAAKPQIQEGLTQEIGTHLQKVLNTENVAVLVDCVHFCCSMRGARDINSSTVTTFLGGNFIQQEVREEFFNTIKI